MRTHVNFTPANKIEAMHEMSNVRAKIEPLSTSRLAQHFISFLYFKYALKNLSARTRDSGNQPSMWRARNKRTRDARELETSEKGDRGNDGNWRRARVGINSSISQEVIASDWGRGRFIRSLKTRCRSLRDTRPA